MEYTNKFYFVTYNRLFNLKNNELMQILFSQNSYLAIIAKDIIFEYRIDELDELSSYKICEMMNLEDAWRLKDCHNKIVLKRALDIVYQSIDDSFYTLRIIK